MDNLIKAYYSVILQQCMHEYSCTYRIEGIFRGYKCSWFTRIRHEPRTFITTNLIFHACMLQKRRYSTNIKSAKTFLKAHPWKFIPSKYTRYTVHHTPLTAMYMYSEEAHPLTSVAWSLVWWTCFQLPSVAFPWGGRWGAVTNHPESQTVQWQSPRRVCTHSRPQMETFQSQNGI